MVSYIEIYRLPYDLKYTIYKQKNKNKNVVFLHINDFVDLYTKSLEEFSIDEKSFNLDELYFYFKNTKMTYRVPISNNIVGFRLRSLNKFIIQINISKLHH